MVLQSRPQEEEALAIADSGNNRVLICQAAP
jgi:hypothetical protein